MFVDKLVAPRMILPLQDGVILTSETDSDDLVKWSDTNGDGVADKREVVFTGIGQSGDANIEHQKAGLLWNMDNWIYTTYNPFRIRWTPTGFLREPTGPNGGQWGLASDDDGKPWFVDAGGERGPMNFQYPIHYGGVHAVRAGRRPRRPRPARGAAAAPPNPNCPPGMENGFEKDFAVVWPAPGIGDMQGGIGRTRMPAQNLNHFTATTGPAIVRGDALPADMKGDLLFTEPVGRLIRRAAIENIEGLTQLRNVYPGAEFMTSVDQLFRPVNISNAPDGTLYIADMYHGIIQERQWSGPGIVPAREDRAVSARQGRGARPHLAAALRRPRRRCRRPTRTSASRRFPRSRRSSRRRRCTARRRRSSSRTSRIRTAGGATRRSGCWC